MRNRIAVCIATCAAPGLALAQSWFPPYPAASDKEYVIYSDSCGEFPPAGTPVLRLLDASKGKWRLEINHNDQGGACLGTPPPGSARTYAFEIPDFLSHGGVSDVGVKQVDVRHQFGAQVLSEQSTGVRRTSDANALPASIAGTWTLAGRAEQGLLINVTSSPLAPAAAVSWNTYGADGTQRWISGIAPLPNGPRDSLSVELTDTGRGTFEGGNGGDATRTWGRIELAYLACGRMTMRWQPESYTGLPAGETTLTQLTDSYVAPCDLAAYARARNGEFVTVSYVTQ